MAALAAAGAAGAFDLAQGVTRGGGRGSRSRSLGAAGASGVALGDTEPDGAEPVRVKEPPRPAATLEVRLDQRRQTIENFGASGCWTLDPIGSEWSVENRERLADLLFSPQKGIGLSLLRFNIGAGGAVTDRAKLWDPWRGAECFRMSASEEYDWSRQAGQQWFLRAAARRGVDQFVAFACSPPVWLTRNGHAHCDKGPDTTNLKPGAEADFARFLADVVEHFRDEGIPIRCVSPINEPNWAWEGGQEGCRYSNDDIVRLLTALHRELSSRRLPVEIEAPEAGDLVSLLDDDLFREWSGSKDPQGHYNEGNNKQGLGKYREYARDLLGSPDLRRALGAKISAHSYWTDSGRHRLVDLRRTLRRNLDRHARRARYWMTEYCVMENGRDLGMDAALRVARVLHHDLVDAEASAWHWWLAVSPHDYKDGLIYTDYRKDGKQSIILSRIYWVLGHYSRFVRAGARRVELRLRSEVAQGREEEDLLASAYHHPRGGALTVVVTNLSREPRRVRLSFDCRPTVLTPYVTSESEALSEQAPLPPGAPYEVPPRSVVTLAGRVPA